MSKSHTNDIRTSSADPQYAGVVFSGSMKRAIKQAQAAPDYGLPSMAPFFYCIPKEKRPNRSRAALLSFLNLDKSTAVGFDR